MPILLEVAPGVWLELSRNEVLWPKLSLLAADGRVSNEVLRTLQQHDALSRETQFQINIFAWGKLRPLVQQLGEEIAR